METHKLAPNYASSVICKLAPNYVVSTTLCASEHPLYSSDMR
jgi:hypothetical protein